MGKPSQKAEINVQTYYKSAILRIFEILRAFDTGQEISFQKKSRTPTNFTPMEARNPELSGIGMHTPYE